MPEQAEGNKKPVVLADGQKPPVSSPPKAPATPPDTKQEQKGLKDEEWRRTLETKLSDLSLENATLRATINEQKVMGDTGDEEVISDIDISDSQIEAITREAENNPAIIKDRIKGVVTQTLNQAQKQQQTVQRKQTKAQAEYRKFTNDIYEHKPHLRQYDEQIGVFAETEFRKTGQGIQSILTGVKQFEEKFGHLIKKEKPGTTEPPEKLPAGAVGLTEPVTTQPEPEPEEPVDMSASALIKRRMELQNKRIHG